MPRQKDRMLGQLRGASGSNISFGGCAHGRG
jgi:hypothetical protein